MFWRLSMKLKKMFKNKLAFTLVELVVVIAILAILAGAVAGGVFGYLANARKTEIKDLAKEVEKSWKLLVTDEEINVSTAAATVATKLNPKFDGITVGTADPSSNDEKYIKITGVGNSQKITVYTKTKRSSARSTTTIPPSR